MNRSRSGQSGSAGSNLRNLVKRTVATSAMPIGMPGWPLLAFSTASIASARRQFAMRNRNGSRGFGSGGAAAVLTSVVALIEERTIRGSKSGGNARHLRLPRRPPSTGMSDNITRIDRTWLRRPAAAAKVAPTRDLPASSAGLGRRQVVRQRILIPPYGGSNPPAPATHGLHGSDAFTA